MPLATPPPALTWNAQALWQDLSPLLPGLTVEVVAQTGSTNADLLERGHQIHRARRTGEPSSADTTHGTAMPSAGGRRQADLRPYLLVAERQTQGRGRQGKVWLSAPGASLTFSLALPLAPKNWMGLSLAVGLSLAETLDPSALAPDGRPPAPRIGLKWPNDLLLIDARCVGRKLGGILIETVPVGDKRLAVIGVGINLATQPDAGALPWGQAHAQELVPGLNAPQLLARLAPALVKAVLAFEQHGFAPLVAPYAKRDLLKGMAVSTSLAELPNGVADGVDSQGMLWLRHGERRSAVGSGEISLLRDTKAMPSTLQVPHNESRPC